MSHQVESMFYLGAEPWHGLGIKLENPPTSADAIVAAGLDWGVELRPVFVRFPEINGLPGTGHQEASNHRAIVRTDNNRILGVVSPTYKPLQNRIAFNFFDPVITAGEAEYHTAGSLKEGQRIWVLAEVKGGTEEIAPGDAVRSFLLLSNGHDGKNAIRVMFTPVRVVCNNTLTAAETDLSVPTLAVPHKGNVEVTLAKVREIMDFTRRTFSATYEQYRWLAKRQVSGIEDYVMLVLGKEFDEPENKLPRSLPKILELFENGRGQKIPAIEGSWWAAYNAVTEWNDYYRRGTRETRLNSSWFGPGRQLKQKALDIALKMAA